MPIQYIMSGVNPESFSDYDLEDPEDYASGGRVPSCGCSARGVANVACLLILCIGIVTLL